MAVLFLVSRCKIISSSTFLTECLISLCEHERTKDLKYYGAAQY